MNIEHVNQGIRARINGTRARRKTPSVFWSLALAATLLGSVAKAQVSNREPSNCVEKYDPSASYPSLPESRGADVTGEAGVVLFLHEDHAVVELGGCFYEVDRPLEVDFAGLDFVELLFNLPEHAAGANLFVTEGDAWIETLEVHEASFSYALMPDDGSLGFEIAAPNQALPTVPVVVAKPHNPEPN